MYSSIRTEGVISRGLTKLQIMNLNRFGKKRDFKREQDSAVASTIGLEQVDSNNIECKVFNFLLLRLEKAAKGEQHDTGPPLEFSKMFHETITHFPSSYQSRYGWHDFFEHLYLMLTVFFPLLNLALNVFCGIDCISEDSCLN